MGLISRLFNQKEEIEIKKINDNSLEYPNISMCEFLYQASLKYSKLSALEYYGKNISYARLYAKIEIVARSLKTIGVSEKDRVAICMPNTPEAIIMFYAINMVGGVASMIHPLSSENEIEYYLELSNSKYILTLDLFADKVIKIAKKINLNKVIVSEASNSMFHLMRRAINFYDGFKNFIYPEDNKKIVYNSKVIKWNDFYDLGFIYDGEYKANVKGSDEAVILFSGGTTGKPKGVRLTNNNFNALSVQCINEFSEAMAGDSVLVILPIFHGFGLGVSIHTELTHGMKCILIPRFKTSDFARLIKKYKPVFLTGVPTMYEALISNVDNTNYLKCVKYCICGGDLLDSSLRTRVNNYLLLHGSNTQIRVGYGLTESTAACILTPNYYYKDNAIGKPFADTLVKIVKPGTTKNLKNNRTGEICISGPTVMLGYLNEDEETNRTIRIHDDGKKWLHTGDLGYIDKSGIVFFSSRLKRMIVTSGYNVYPSYLEKIIDSHPAVDTCIVVGISHNYKKQVPVACIKLKDNYYPSEELTLDIKKYCAESISKYAMPYKYEYIKQVPKTIIGKINYKKLEDDCEKKYGTKNS